MKTLTTTHHGGRGQTQKITSWFGAAKSSSRSSSIGEMQPPAAVVQVVEQPTTTTPTTEDESPPPAKRPRLEEEGEEKEEVKVVQAVPVSTQAPTSLTPEQQLVLDSVVNLRQNVFCTGNAGTGKSFLLRLIRKRCSIHSTFVTASTGVAAVNIGGVTLHGFAGIQNDSLDVETLVRIAFSKNKSAVARWKQCELLIVDEVSMVSGSLLDKLDAVARRIRGVESPFGGIRVLFFGDFCQLPPVSKDSGRCPTPDFCFLSSTWRDLALRTVRLTRVFRQADAAFTQILNELRMARLSPASLEALRARVQPPPKDLSVPPTKLRSLNREVDAENSRNLAALPGQIVEFEAMDTGEAQHLLNGCIAPKTLQLKVGAQVILVKNVDPRKRLVNGSRGVVKQIDPVGDRVYVQFADALVGGNGVVAVERVDWTIERAQGGQKRAVVATRSQIPLRLAWALSVHKCQGMELDCVEMTTRGVFEYGQLYVALSRVRTLEGLYLTEFNPACARTHPAVLDFYRDEPEVDPSVAVDVV